MPPDARLPLLSAAVVGVCIAVGLAAAGQGMIQIFGLDGGDESGPYSPTSSVVKKIRVVSTFEFDLE